MTTYYPALNELFVFLNTTITQISRYTSRIPGSSILLKYVKNSHQDDPYRSLLELLLACFVVWYLFAKKYRTDNFIELTRQEVEELVDEWQPEPLVTSLSEKQRWELEKTPVIVGPPGHKPKMSNGDTVINLASFDFLGLSNNELIKEKAIKTLREYGVGACGPPGFYGTMDVHTEFERNISKFLGTEESILYSQGFSTISSAIPSFCKRGCNFAIQKGIQISRSIVKWFNHNDMNDLERILKEIRAEDIETGRQLTRRFIVTEGIFQNFGDIAPLPELIELKKKYKYRIILDESLSVGTLGQRGAGLTDYFNIKTSDVDMIVGSMCHALCSSGGFCSGSHEITDYQRISGPAYCFSAALPAPLAVSASESLAFLSQNTHLLVNLQENSRAFRNMFKDMNNYVRLDGAADSPVLHLRLNKQVLDFSEGNDDDNDNINSNRLYNYHGRRHNNNLSETSDDSDKADRVLQEIVDKAMNNGVLLTRAKYVRDQEHFGIEPSIRICISASFTKKEVENIAITLKNVITNVLRSKTREIPSATSTAYTNGTK